MLDTVKINHVQHISFTQSRLTDAVSVILSELLSYEHPSKRGGRLSHVIHQFQKKIFLLCGERGPAVKQPFLVVGQMHQVRIVPYIKKLRQGNAKRFAHGFNGGNRRGRVAAKHIGNGG